MTCPSIRQSVVLHPLAPLVPVLGLHHVIGHPLGRQPPVQVVAERARLIARVDLPGQALLFGHEAHKPFEGHLLDRLRRGPVHLPGDVKPLGAGVNSELDRGAGFGRLQFTEKANEKVEYLIGNCCSDSGFCRV